MANGIMDTLTNIRRTGDPMGGPPVDPSMTAGVGGGPPVAPSMMIDPSMMMGGGGGEPPPTETDDTSQESALLVEAVGERTGYNPEESLAILSGAMDIIEQQIMGGAGGAGPLDPSMIAGAGGPPPMGGAGPMMGGPPPIMANKGRYLYRDNGGDISDNDTLRQMIMDNLNTNQNFAKQLSLEGGENLSDLVRLALAANSQEGRTISDKDNAMMAAMIHGQEGREITDKDLALHTNMLEAKRGRTMSDRDMGRTMSDEDLVQLLDDIRLAKGN